MPGNDGMLPGGTMWMSPPTSEPRKRPAAIYTNIAYTSGDEMNPISAWSGMHLQQVTDPSTSRSSPITQEMLPLAMSGHDEWNQPSCGEVIDFHGLDSEGAIGQAYTTDEAVPIIDLRYSNQSQEAANLNMEDGIKQRRLSNSSLTVSTSEPMSDIPSSYEDYPAGLSEAPSYASDYLSTASNRTSLMSSIQLSPVASPRATPQSRPEQVRTQSRGRASPSPRPSVRSAPYTLETSKNQRWSTGSYAPTQNRRQSPMIFHGAQDGYATNQRMSLQNYPPLMPAQSFHPGGIQGHPPHQPPFVVSGQPMFARHGMIPPAHMPHQGMFEQPPPLPSHGIFKMLQSNGDPHMLHGHYTDLSDPPDLFGPLAEEQVPPPEEDMNHSDPNMIPYEQDLRFDGDLYTPRWVRGHGNKREGWCGICKPGRWLVLKNSAFWYDKSFTHGISAATGHPFEEPLDTRRMDGNPDVWEGLCTSCNDWVPLVSSKKKGTTWFRHAYKCHTHQKVKDMPKRRREMGSSSRKLAAQTPKTKLDATVQQPMTPQSVTTPVSGLHTPCSVPPLMPQLHLQVLHHQQQMPPHTEPPASVSGPDSMCLSGGPPPISMPPSTSIMGNMI
ncbi:Meiotic expression up-regulated protein 26 [Metarhizium brunneum]|uniref:Meiotic expression up-regulated protein 26 n=1 Tax=Metarhizium brunneum TaxID=500148 RepID=A0A7D5USN8_9HYPO|nr:Meiotic expression up-regulated protein 26 [Metarhizium brunneum]